MRKRSISILLAVALVLAVSAPAWAATKTISTKAVDITIIRDEGGYDLIIRIDPLKLYRAKHPDAVTYWKTVHDDGRIKIEIDPIFVVGAY